MINRDMVTAVVTTLSGATANISAYGVPQPVTDQQGKVVTRDIQIYKKIYSQVNVEDPRYVDVDEIALTKDRDVTTKDRLTVDGVTYAVSYVIPSRRYYTLLLRRL